jgi:hypothetical protein
VHEILELQLEVPGANRPQSASRLKLALAVVVGAVAAFLGALALSVLLAQPASAATLPGSSGPDPTGPITVVTQPVAPAVGALTTPTVDAIAPLTRPATEALNPVLLPVAAALTPVVNPVVTEVTPALRPVLDAATPLVAPLVTTLIPLVSPALALVVPAIIPIDGALSVNGTNLHTAPFGAQDTDSAAASFDQPVPAPSPHPVGPFPRFPAGTSPSAADGSAASGGGNSPAAHPPLGLLLPSPLVGGFSLGRSKSPQLLLDLRHSPPG